MYIYDKILQKCGDRDSLDRLQSLDDVNQIALTLCKETTHTYRSVTLRQSPNLNSIGYGLSKAPIIGLLVRIEKLFKLVCRFYEMGNGDYFSVFTRPLIESSIIATYLLLKGDEAVEDFRLCSYKHTYSKLARRESGDEYFNTPAGVLVFQSALDDLALEGLSMESFNLQRQNRWRLQGKSIFKIFSEIVDPKEYTLGYGILSESIHGSWNNSLDNNLIQKKDNTFLTYSLFKNADARSILPLIRYTMAPYVLWCKSIQLFDSSIDQTFNLIRDYSFLIFYKFDELFNGKAIGSTELPLIGTKTSSKEKSSVSEEFQDILTKYDSSYLKRLFSSKTGENALVSTFFEDVAKILDILIRMRNIERNPTGFSSDDAAILGLLVSTWKLLNLVIWIYNEESAENAPIVERSLIEVAVTATYLLQSSNSILEDYRLCSYKHRIKMLKQASSGSEYYRSKAGKRLLCSINKKLKSEGLDKDSFEVQIQNGWRVQGMTFFQVFKEVVSEDLYTAFYGPSSDFVHGTWLNVKNYSLQGNLEQGFSPRYQLVRESIGNVSMIIPFAIMPFRDWVKRVELNSPYIHKVLDQVEIINKKLFEKFGEEIFSEN